MIGTNTSETLSIVAAAMLIGVIGAHLPSVSRPGPQPTAAAAFAPVAAPAVPGVTPVSATLGAGGCGPREIRVFDAKAGEYRMRTADVCWREIL